MAIFYLMKNDVQRVSARRILVIDDDPDVLGGLKERLEAEFGFDVEAIGDVGSAVERLRQRSSDFDLVITDMDFGSSRPEGGLEVVEAVNQREQGRCPVIVLTGRAALQNAVRSMELGAFTYVEKALPEDSTHQALGHAIRRALKFHDLQNAAARRKEEQLLDLDRARQFQRRLLPPIEINTGPYSIASKVKSCTAMAGDFVWVGSYPNGRNVVSLADVVGHGTSAAFLAGMLWVALEEASKVSHSLESFWSALAECARFLELPAFSVLGLVELGPDGLVRLLNASNPDILHASTGRIDFHPSIHRPLYILGGPDRDPPIVDLDLDRGDLLVMVTDGVTESRNENDEEYGIARVGSVVANRRDGGPMEVVQRLFADVESIAGGRHQADDMSAVAIEYSA